MASITRKGGYAAMNQKNLIIIAVAAIVAIGAYLMFGGGYFNPPAPK